MEQRQLRILVDTSVWLDRFLPQRPHADAANQLISLCAADDIALLFPMSALHDVYFQVTQNNRLWVESQLGLVTEAHDRAINEMAWDCINNMMEVGVPVGADASDVWVAQRLRAICDNFGDDMVLAAAQRADADYLVTCDKQLAQKATVAALAPEDMLAVLRMRQ